MRIFLLKYSGYLLLGLLIEYWIVWHSSLNLPQNIPQTTIRIEGIFLLGVFLLVLILALHAFFKTGPNTSILKLTGVGTTICFISLGIFHAIRQFFINADTLDDRLYFYFLGTIGMSVFGAILSFLIAFQIKTRKTGQLILLIIGFTILSNVIQHIFSKLPI